MTQDEFQRLPWLVFGHQVQTALGYSRPTLRKMVDCGLLTEVRPPSCTQRKYLKVQLAEVLGMDVTGEVARFRKEPLLMAEKSAVNWTGYTPEVLQAISKAGGLQAVRLAGQGWVRYRKMEVARLIGFERFL